MTSPSIPPWITDPDTPTDHLQKEATLRKEKREATHTLHGYIHRQTEKAILFEVIRVNDTPLVPEGEEGHNEWFPLSQTSTVSQAANAADHDYIVVSDWIARVKNIL